MKDRIDHIVKWIKDYANKYNKTTLVIGVSGGIDSAVASTLCAMTGIKVIPIVMSIKNKDTLANDLIIPQKTLELVKSAAGLV